MPFQDRAAIAHHAPEAGDWPELFAPERVRDCVSISQPSHISCVRTAIVRKMGWSVDQGSRFGACFPTLRNSPTRFRLWAGAVRHRPARKATSEFARAFGRLVPIVRGRTVWTSTAFDLAFPWCARCGVFRRPGRGPRLGLRLKARAMQPGLLFESSTATSARACAPALGDSYQFRLRRV